ncbi:MAG: CHAT domain-containing protein [Blastocatellia bacterium]|nr:CHAT domain-containing protein [Blastocatellia bacterium]
MHQHAQTIRRSMMSFATVLLAIFLVSSIHAQDITPLEPGKPITRTAKRQQVDTYSLSLTAGQFIRVLVEQSDVDVSVDLVALDNKSLQVVNYSSPFGLESLSWEATTNGTYKIIIRALGVSRPEASYQVQIELKDTATAQDQQRIKAEQLFNDAVRAGQSALPLDQRIERGRQAIQIWRELGDKQWEAMTLDRTGVLYNQSRKHDLAIETLKEALAIKHEIQDRLGKIFTLNLMASLLLNQAMPTLSGIKATQLPQQNSEWLEQALALSREIKQRGAERYTLENFANQCRLYGLVEKFLEYKEQVVVIDHEGTDRSFETNTIHHIGFTLFLMGYHEKALEYYRKALAMNLEIKSLPGQGINYREFSNTYTYLGQYDKAIEYQEKALAIWRELKNESQEGGAYGNLGLIYGLLNQNEKALEYQNRALEIARKTKNLNYEAIALVNIGDVYLKLGRLSEAKDYDEKGLKIYREQRNRRGESEALWGLGRVFSKQNLTAQAIESYEQALKISRDIRMRFNESCILSELADELRKIGQTEKAINYHLQSFKIARETKAKDTEAFALDGLLFDWKERSQPHLAIYFGKLAVNAYQEIRSGIRSLDLDSQQSFLKSKESTYRELADLLIAQGRLPEAEQVIRMLKEEEYFEYVRRDVDNSSKGERASLTPEEAAIEKRYREIADKLSEIGSQRSELLAKPTRSTEEEQLLAKLEGDLTVANQMFQKFLDGLATEMAKQKDGSANITKLRDAQGLMEDLRELGKGVVALYTLVGENKYRVILTTADFQRAYEYPIKAAELNRKILAFRATLQNPKLDPLPLAQELYQILVGPVAKDLRGTKAQMLMWSLDGVLRYVPVAALHDGEKYLVERFRNAVFTPVSNARFKDEPSRNWKALGLGVTKSFGANIPALPGVAEEMRGIINDGSGKGVLPGTIKLDEQFTQEAMLTGLRQRNPVVHVASHFQFKPGNETDSALLLGDGQFLSLAQIKALPQVFSGVELLTLSACNTATSGSGANGKEVEGFGALAQKQGAKAVIASLWPVADRSTKNLMQEFYRLRETKGNLTKAEAMRQAQMKLLRGELQVTGAALAVRDITHETDKTTNLPPYKVDPKAPYAHPYYWAPFILIGNWK